MAQQRVPKHEPPRGPQNTDDAPHDVLAAEEFGMGTPDPRLHVEPAHDVLAAEEFGMGTPDPRLHVEPAHDVLAAEEFAVGDSDPILHHHGPVALPSDPTGIAEPHDVLAAEEFAMPAPRGRPPVGVADSTSTGSWRRGRGLPAAGLLVLLLLWRLRRN
jgi:hypothetical protein